MFLSSLIFQVPTTVHPNIARLLSFGVVNSRFLFGLRNVKFSFHIFWQGDSNPRLVVHKPGMITTASCHPFLPTSHWSLLLGCYINPFIPCLLLIVSRTFFLKYLQSSQILSIVKFSCKLQWGVSRSMFGCRNFKFFNSHLPARGFEIVLVTITPLQIFLYLCPLLLSCYKCNNMPI